MARRLWKRIQSSTKACTFLHVNTWTLWGDPLSKRLPICAGDFRNVPGGVGCQMSLRWHSSHCKGTLPTTHCLHWQINKTERYWLDSFSWQGNSNYRFSEQPKKIPVTTNHTGSSHHTQLHTWIRNKITPKYFFLDPSFIYICFLCGVVGERQSLTLHPRLA